MKKNPLKFDDFFPWKKKEYLEKKKLYFSF
jgi:hypothetical protein